MTHAAKRQSRALPAAIASVLSAAALLETPALAQNGPGRLEEVVVTSSIVETPRRRLGTAVSVVDAVEIELRGYNSIADVLRTQPSIGVSNSGGPGKGTTLRIRGEEGYRTMLMIDGVKAVDPTPPQVQPRFDSLLTTADLARVEILRGPQGFIYGADAGGVVNILTRTGAGAPGGQLDLELGERGARKIDASVSGGGEAGDYFLSVSDLETDGFNAQPADAALMDDDGAENTTLHAKLGWNAADHVRLQLVARDVDASTQYDGCFDSITFATVHDCVSTNEQTTYKLSAEHSAGRFVNAFGYSEIDIFSQDFSEGALSFGSDGAVSRFEYTGSYEPSEATTIVYGLDFQNEEVADGGTMERDQEGYYVEYQGSFDGRFFVSLGARRDDNEDFGSHTSTRVSGAYVQNLGSGNALKYRASFGTGFRPPSLFEISYNNRPAGVYPPAAANPLTEEASSGYDLGIEYDMANGLHLEATYFDQKIDDKIDYIFDGTTFTDGYIQTPGTSTSSGIELAVDAPLNERWVLLANWTNNDSEMADGSVRLLRPEDLGNLGLRFISSDERLRFLANYRISGDAVDVGGVRLDSYEILDLTMSYAFNGNFDIHARIENATDEDYTEAVGYNTADRAAYAGVRIRF